MTKCTDVERLQLTIQDMDSVAQDALSKIATLSVLALGHLKTKPGNDAPAAHALKDALSLIQYLADDTGNTLGLQAEGVGLGGAGAQL